MIFENTAAASLSRLTGSLPLAIRGAIARVAARIMRILVPLRSPGKPYTGFWATPFPTARVAPTGSFVEPIHRRMRGWLVWSRPSVGRVTVHGQVTRRGQRPRSARQAYGSRTKLKALGAPPNGAKMQAGAV